MVFDKPFCKVRALYNLQGSKDLMGFFDLKFFPDSGDQGNM